MLTSVASDSHCVKPGLPRNWRSNRNWSKKRRDDRNIRYACFFVCLFENTFKSLDLTLRVICPWKQSLECQPIRDALQQNRKEVAQAYFETWTTVGIGWKITHLSILRCLFCFVCLFVCLFCFNIPWYVFHHLHVIPGWFSNIFRKKILLFSAACHIQKL